jgi:curved DNA-binding protein CbpA
MCSISEDYYAILEATQDDDYDAIRTNYKRLAKLLHPDKDPTNPNATSAFQSVRYLKPDGEGLLELE